MSNGVPHDTASGRAGLALLLLAMPLTALAWGGKALHVQHGWLALLAIAVVTGAGAALAARVGARANIRHALAIILATALAMRLGVLWDSPYLSNDVLRYVWDGRVQGAGINPYRYLPVAPELEFLRDPVIWPHINRADYAPTIYPPTAQISFFLITRFGDSITAMKAGLMAFELITVISLMGILHRLGRPLVYVAAYAWHPLPVWEIAGTGHVDGVMVALLMLSLWVFLSGRSVLAGVVATAAALVKPTALLALPAFWRAWEWRLPGAVIVTAALLYLPYLSVGWGVLGFLPSYAQEEGIASGSGFWLLRVIGEWAGPLGEATFRWLQRGYLALAALILTALALRAGFRRARTPQTVIADIALMVGVFLFLLSPDYPWYFLAAVPFLALVPSLALWVLTVGGVVLYHVIPGDPVPPFFLRESALYAGVLAAAFFDLGGGRLPAITLRSGVSPR